MSSQFAITQNPKNLEIMSDIASELNDNHRGRTKLVAMIQEERVSRILSLIRMDRHVLDSII